MRRLYVHGRSRSGTTITQKILNSHSDIQLFNEKSIYFSEKCMDVEKELYDGKSLYFGDKGYTPDLEIFKKWLLLDMKYIYIYRDGRDCVSSVLRINKKSPPGKDIWRSPDIRINSKDWADHFFLWEKAKKTVIPSKCWLDIKFEDYIDYPDKNAVLISNFLNVGVDQMVKIHQANIDPGKMHRNAYKKWVPDWKKKFHPDAIYVLEKLGYI